MAATPAPVPTNTPDLTVSELSSALKRTIEDRFGFVRVRGEVSNYRGPHSSGHCYFSLKDEGARIDAVIWKGNFQRLKVKPAEGLEVIATGKITTFPGKSAYQIVIETIEPAGLGALMALLEERRRKLAAEGLFDQERKQLIPYLPASIGVITSPTGAVIRDILHRISDRFPVPVLVWPVRVQGETSATEVAHAIEGFNALPEDGPIPRPSVLIVARGGGSFEDLMGFNEEVVVRAAAASFIPLVSAVGHETDWTLIDHAADLRAPTPTGAAEMCVPVRSELVANVATAAGRLRGATLRFLERQRADLRAAARALRAGDELLAPHRQRLDRAGERLGARLEATMRARHLRLGRAAQLLARHSPQAELARSQERLAGLARRLERDRGRLVAERTALLLTVSRRLVAARAATAALARHRIEGQRERLALFHARLQPALAAGHARRTARLAGLAQLLGSLGYRNVLARGFALVRDADGHPLRAAAQVGDGMRLALEFADGRIGATADGTAAPGDETTPVRPKAESPRRPKTRDGGAGQGSLF
jgi:exodeoxyribonuclease VII large subunit